ncbi:uncharacterized protein AMSG_08150 [Thecamonas trahens ATCC 50062]|uniref:Ankyrin repeat protein n=1 Tax=Thecamonas trahens ATCC 50062 TaxID=461836 RepID=A0A0L0DHR6_THETB|nr:hypothetical protein AMSG_08150 [Thecamonas trahens ATCC 50062]KNC51914.1 hypothetical protein AMSG_08150 [Thecamonas trahens ATCC 50062]|eukprot:XP_013755511.1 hypothetical protein AMSG_08150 [Thecamonas trahens ATCC 50062]
MPVADIIAAGESLIDSGDGGEEEIGWRMLVRVLAASQLAVEVWWGVRILAMLWYGEDRWIGVGTMLACGGKAYEALAITLVEVVDDADKTSMLMVAASQGLVALVTRLLNEPGVEPTADESCALRWAGGTDTPTRSCFCSPMGVAAESGHVDVVAALLVDGRVDPGVGNNYAISAASSCGHPEVVTLLIADPRVDSSILDKWR